MKNLPISSNSKYKQTLIEVTKEDGYIGSKQLIRCMSSYEMKAVKLLKQLYKLKRIKGFSSEEVVIPYISTKDGKPHRYFIDFAIELEDKIVLVEVKPYSKTQKPKLRRNSTEKQVRNYHIQMQEYILNNDKWSATRQYCEEMNRKQNQKKFKFVIWTEKELHIT